MRRAALLLLATAAAAGAAPPSGRAPSREVIGVATQEADGTLVLQLRTPADSGVVGDALVRYPPGDPNYAAVSRHVGPIPKGGSVFVTRFED